MAGQNTAVIAACAIVGGVIVLVGGWLLVRWSAAPKSLPLPPKQPLARERELLASVYQPRYISLDMPLVAPSTPFSAAPSTPFSAAPSTPFSAAPSTPFSAAPSTPFSATAFPSLSSFTDSAENGFPSSSSLPATPLSPADSQLSRASSAHLLHRPPRSRPVSMYSSHSICGTPHGPNSNVQIVLPAPLGPSLNPSTVSLSHRRMSVIDQWASIPTLPPDLRKQSSVSSLSSTSSVPRRHSYAAPLPSSPESSLSPPPPVPPLPSKFSNTPPSSYRSSLAAIPPSRAMSLPSSDSSHSDSSHYSHLSPQRSRSRPRPSRPE